MINKIKLPDHSKCTACGACINACPENCISFIADRLGCLYPEINSNKCIGCGKCQSVCHLNGDFFLSKKSKKVYAAWSSIIDVRHDSASGGIASEIYRLGLSNRVHCFGVRYLINQGAVFFELHSVEDIISARNSKYVFSDTGKIYTQIKEYLSKDERVIFIGLPCQVAGLKAFLKGKLKNIITIDLICHGVCPYEYLKQHIEKIEKKIRMKIDTVSFRDASFGTEEFRFTCKHKNNLLYNKGVYEDDLYQIGYHKALTYRENCYYCRYARAERVGDLTISDFSGLGKLQPWMKPRKSISCIIVSTEKGENLLNELKKAGSIIFEKRPCEEAYNYEHMLQNPSVPHPNRELFKKIYIECNLFDVASRIVLVKEIRRNRFIKFFHVKKIRLIILKLIPKKLKNWLKYRRGN
jgi:coenzyme F420-reducing hydrogenase beta subunit